nr:hypothetical protein Iba_chr13bCG1010 [Ipomoea batatas]
MFPAGESTFPPNFHTDTGRTGMEQGAGIPRGDGEYFQFPEGRGCWDGEYFQFPRDGVAGMGSIIERATRIN